MVQRSALGSSSSHAQGAATGVRASGSAAASAHWLAREETLSSGEYLARFVHASLENRERKHEKMDILYSFTRAEIIEREICRLGIYYPRIYNYTSVPQFFLQSFSAG